MSETAIAKKQQEVATLAEKINNSAATVVVQYEGLTVEKFSELRNNLREEKVEIKVIKNNISSRAFKEAKVEEIVEDFSGCTAVAFSEEDVTAAARILKEFSKENPQLVLKAGTLNGEYSSAETIAELATLPNHEGMLSMLLSVLEAPIRGLAQVTSQVAEQKED
jgi:large subunit ribosomal protein L10